MSRLRSRSLAPLPGRRAQSSEPQSQFESVDEHEAATKVADEHHEKALTDIRRVAVERDQV